MVLGNIIWKWVLYWSTGQHSRANGYGTEANILLDGYVPGALANIPLQMGMVMRLEFSCRWILYWTGAEISCRWILYWSTGQHLLANGYGTEASILLQMDIVLEHLPAFPYKCI